LIVGGLYSLVLGGIYTRQKAPRMCCLPNQPGGGGGGEEEVVEENFFIITRRT